MMQLTSKLVGILHGGWGIQKVDIEDGAALPRSLVLVFSTGNILTIPCEGL